MSFMNFNIANSYSKINSKTEVALCLAECYDLAMEIKEIRHKNLEFLLEKHCGKSQADLGRKTGLGPAYTYQLVSKRRPMGDRTARKIEKAFELSRGWMDSLHSARVEHGESPDRDSKTPSFSHPGSPRKEIPVVGTTQGGPDRHWEELGYPTGWGDEYAVIESDDPHAYILRVEGDSMSPRVNEGDYVLVEPSIEAQPGDTVVVRMVSGEVVLKYFRADYGEEIALESHNHGFTMKTVRKADIVFIHPVSGTLYRRKIKKR